ncbi:MAG: gliding motility protein RemB, partial [Flavobacterium sp.]|nr:gliding motility protein RemB [Candidatus Neoflavobacterium equi]
TYNYGGNIYLSYDDQRYQDINDAVGQGNKTKIINGELQAGYLINPNMNLKLFGSYVYRNFKPTVETPNVVPSQTNWLSIGIRSDLFNMYSDF